ncbi:heparan-alpha-glucosaminide N-acetyltransferase domain-containing protein [Zobellella sp. DQSA1]|uniref:heparan-alpha-glucosaminide N-acetyltransferase domain-containing protein n=1 Tax=Zobellella sp. DQSA1 TaxID=3342386 RepID=UPI0035C0340A
MTSERITSLPKQSMSRVASFDLARGLAVLFMMLVHVMDFYGQPGIGETAFGKIIKFLGSPPAAPIFTFIMGIFIASSSRQSLASGLARAAWLLALGYMLNLARGSLPMWLSLQMGLVTYEQLGGYTPLTELLIVDILQFAGLALAICVLLKHYFPDPRYWIVAGLAVVCLSPALWDISSGWMVPDAALQLLWGSKEQGAMFPLFPWLAFPLFGMAFGHWFGQSGCHTRFFRKTLWAGLVLMTAGTSLILFDMDFHYGYYLRSGPGGVIWITGFVMVWLWLCRLIVGKAGSNRCLALLFFWSQNVTVIYVLQWLVIGWGLMLVGAQQLDLTNTMLAMAVVVLLSDLASRVWLRLRGHHHPAQAIESGSQTTADPKLTAR